MSLEPNARRTRTDVVNLDSGLEALQESPEFSGAVEPLDGNHCYDHLAHLFEDPAEQVATAIPFLRQGLERGERCMCVVDRHSKEDVVGAMRDAGVDVDAALDDGALTFPTVEETYLRGGTFDPDEMIEFYGAAIDEATEEYEALRISAETTWMQDDSVTFEEFMEYESRVNRLFDEKDVIAICHYDRTAFAPEVVRDIVETHPHLIYDGTVCHNFYHTPPEEFGEPNRAAREVDRMMGTLLERTEAKVALQTRERFLRRMYEVAADPGRSFREKVEQMLELGCERFGLDQGYVTQFHRNEDVVENQHVVGPDDQDLGTGTPDAQAKPGQFCRRTVEVDEPVGSSDVSELGWDDDPVYRESGLRSYFGVKITDGAGPYGTLAFCDQEAREEPFTDAEWTFLELMGQWVSHVLEQRRREDQLAALNEMSRAVMGAESNERIAELAVEYAEGSLDLPLTAVVTYDGHSGDLSPVARTLRADDELPTAGLCERDGGDLWETFVSSEARVLDDVAALPGAGDDVTETQAVPLGQQGLFVTATTAPGGFSDAEDDLVAATAATVETAFTRAEREEQLQERETMLEEQNDTLGRLNRVNDIIRNIDQSLVGAASRDEIRTVVCEQLAEVGPYEMAWIGEHDAVTDEVVPIESAGAEKSYLEEVTVTADDRPEGQGPVGRAVRTRESHVVDEILQDDSFDPWHQEALNRGYHSCISLPLVYGETLYGVVAVYASQPGVFGELERSVLDELSDTIAYAINAIESKKALVSDEVTRLEFEVEDSNFSLLEVTEELDCTFSQESVVPRPDGGVRDYSTSRGAPAADILEYANRLPAVDVTLISEHEEDGEPVCLFESNLTDESLTAAVLAHGGQPRSIVTGDGTASVTVEVAADAAVREFVEMIQSKFPDSELVAQRSLERPSRTPTEHRVSLTEELTERQLEALQTAYFGGYFEQPRIQKGTDVAETLGVSQPTFTSHLRAAHRKVCQQLFDEDALEP